MTDATSQTAWTWCDSPVGPLQLHGHAGGLTSLRFLDRPPSGGPIATGWGPAEALLREAVEQLRSYFARRRREFDLPLDPQGTPFQIQVWSALREIPYGETLSYGKLALRLGSGTCPRAVGTANGQNPLAILIPCHRVIGADGSLTGYGGGLDRKRYLLELEGWRSGGPYQLELGLETPPGAGRRV